MTESIYPFLLQPIYKTYLWAGKRLAPFYRRAIPGNLCSESWEVSDRAEGMSLIANGPLAGQSLCEALGRSASAILGPSAKTNRFPLLMKIIDAGQRLSVQVHPDNDSALRLRAEPKTEMWYILDAEPGASIFAGLRPGTEKKDFEEALQTGTVENLLVRYPATPGSVFFIPGGRVHAIGEGCLLFEVQQSSNTTYRVYDWGRTDETGKPRELHIPQAMECIRWDDTEPSLQNPPLPASDKSVQELLRCPFFQMNRISVRDNAHGDTGQKAYHVLFTEKGAVTLHAAKQEILIPEGASCLIPAVAGAYTIRARDARATVLQITG